jgi:hypothetical protein
MVMTPEETGWDPSYNFYKYTMIPGNGADFSGKKWKF